MRDPETVRRREEMHWGNVLSLVFFRLLKPLLPALLPQGNSKGFGFVSYDSFEASDAAIEAMNGQYLCNRPISVMYAYKKARSGATPPRREAPPSRSPSYSSLREPPR